MKAVDASESHQIPLSIRTMQMRGALCLAAFCKNFHIEHESIHALTEHLLCLMTTQDLPAWNTKGAQLAITGRGDPLPQELDQRMPQELREGFTQLMEYAVEIGIADLYGAHTDQPSRFLSECISILNKHGVAVPWGDEFPTIPAVSNWGVPVGASVLDELLQPYVHFLRRPNDEI